MGTGTFTAAAAVGLLSLAVAPWSTAAIVLDLPDASTTPGNNVNLPMNVSFGAGDSLITTGYQLYLSVTGPSAGVTLGSATGFPAPLLATVPSGFIPAADAPIIDVYEYTDFLMSGSATVNPGVFATITVNVAEATTPGAYQINWYLVEDAYKSQIFDEATAEATVTFTGGTLTVNPVPEPAVLLSLGVFSTIALLRPRASRA